MDAQRRPTLAAGPATRGSDALALGSFVILGLPDGILGTVWPSMRVTFGAPVGDLGLILLLATVSSVLVTAFVGTLIRRLGVPALLVTSGLCAATGYAGFALAPGFAVVLGVAALTGVAASLMDAGLNTAVALAGRPRLLNLLHGAYGIGTAVGPLIVTAAILTGSWRPAYVTLTGLDLVIAAFWLRQRRRATPPPAPPASATPAPTQTTPAPTAPTTPAPAAPAPAEPWSRRRYGAVVATGMSVFFLYTGLEVGAGQWEASFCRGHLNMSATATGLATFGYWGALTAVRITLALLPRPVPPRLVVRFGTVLAVAATAVTWGQPGTVATVLPRVCRPGRRARRGLPRALVSLTPARLGERRAQHVITWQVGAAAAGGAGVSAIIGLIIGAGGLAVLGPSLAVLALLLVSGELVLAKLAPVPR